MLKRALMTLMFAAALAAVGVGTASKAEAHGYRHGCGRGYGGHHGYRAAYIPVDYGYYPAYRTYFGPRYPYSPGFDRPYYGHGGYGRSGVSFSIGF